MSTLLADRAASPQLYAEGDYQPLALKGDRATDLVGFTRRDGSGTLMVLATRIAGGEAAVDALPVGPHWAGVTANVAGEWEDVLTGRTITADEAGLSVAEVLAILPVAVLRKR